MNGDVNKKEVERGETYREWTDILDTLRKMLNNPKYRTIRKDKEPYQTKPVLAPAKPPKFKTGDALGHKQPTANFREGDYRYARMPAEVVQVIPRQREGAVAVRAGGPTERVVCRVGADPRQEGPRP